MADHARLCEAVVARVLLPVLRALDFLSSIRVMHRGGYYSCMLRMDAPVERSLGYFPIALTCGADIKPGNILLNSAGQVKVRFREHAWIAFAVVGC